MPLSSIARVCALPISWMSAPNRVIGSVEGQCRRDSIRCVAVSYTHLIDYSSLPQFMPWLDDSSEERMSFMKVAQQV